MKFFLISDNSDTQMGMRMTGIEGVVVHESNEVKAALEKAVADPDIGIILITEKLIHLCHDMIYELKLKSVKPLIVEIPDRHGTSNITETIGRYISEAVGIKI